MSNNNKKYLNISEIEDLVWAFEKGYYLAASDIKEGIYIDFKETKSYFLEVLANINSGGGNEENSKPSPPLFEVI